MTMQEALERNVEHFLIHRQLPSVELRDNGRGFRCFYQSPAGCRCAVGVLLPEGQYQAAYDELEEGPADVLLEAFPELQRFFAGVETEFLVQLQEAHDQSAKHWTHEGYRLATPEEFRQWFYARLGRLAQRWDLTLPQWREETTA